MSCRIPFSLRAVVLGLALAVPTLSTPDAQAGPRPPYRVTIHASHATVTAGQLVTFTGQVRPATKAARKQNVRLEVTFPNGVSSTTDRDRPDRKGRYVLTESFRVPGDYLVRTRIAAGKGHSEGVSDQVKITVVPLSVP